MTGAKFLKMQLQDINILHFSSHYSVAIRAGRNARARVTMDSTQEQVSERDM
jgi:hypothetical protein